MQVVRNGTTGQVEHGYASEVEQRNSYATAARMDEGVETTDMFEPDSNIDYLDIPSFLRNQAD